MVAGKARPTRVRPHQRNGKPVRGYVQHRSLTDKWAAIIRGDEQGNVKAAVAGSLFVGAGLSLWWALSMTMTVAEAGIVMVGAMGSAMGLWAGARHRRNGRIRYPTVTISPRVRRARLRNKLRKKMPMAQYRTRRDNFRRKHKLWTSYYDRHIGKYEVTATTGKGKKRRAVTKTVRGVVARDTLLAQAREKERQAKEANASYSPWNISSRQVFR